MKVYIHIKNIFRENKGSLKLNKDNLYLLEKKINNLNSLYFFL